MAQVHAALAAVDGLLHLHPGRYISSVDVPYGRIRDCIDTSAAESLPIKDRGLLLNTVSSTLTWGVLSTGSDVVLLRCKMSKT